MPRDYKTIYRPTKEDRAKTKRMRAEALREAEAALTPEERAAYLEYFVPGLTYSEHERMACLQKARAKVLFRHTHGASEDAKSYEPHLKEFGYGTGRA